MKKMIMASLLFVAYICDAKESPIWRHNGIYIVNKSDGTLTIKWGKKSKILAPAKEGAISKILIPITKPNVKIDISYSNNIAADADMPTCRGGAHLSLKTNKNIKLYEIYGGYEEGWATYGDYDDQGGFTRPGTGPHCSLSSTMRHHAYPVDHAIEMYPDLK